MTTVATMEALQLTRWGGEAELQEVPVPQPGAGEVLLEVTGAGLCHTDLHLMDWAEGTLPYRLPFTLGHEVAGMVVAAAPGVTGITEGESVLVYSPRGCERCWRCARGETNVCELAREADAHALGLGLDGGLAPYMLARPHQLVPLGDLDPAQAAPLADAALTPYSVVKAALPLLRPGTEAVVIGVGGLGHVAIQLLRQLSPARVVALDIREEALGLAGDAGAHVALHSGRDATEIRAELSSGAATLVIDFVGIDATLALATELLSDAGRLVIVGVGGGVLPVTAYERPPLGGTVSTPNWGTRPELIEVVELARAGLIEIEIERIRLGEALAAYQRMRDGGLLGRVVVTQA